jgi:hypothetical protein
MSNSRSPVSIRRQLVKILGGKLASYFASRHMEVPVPDRQGGWSEAFGAVEPVELREVGPK